MTTATRTATRISITIPCVDNIFTEIEISYVFHRLKIGKTVVNSLRTTKGSNASIKKGTQYIFATLELANTSCAIAFLRALSERGQTHIVYDEPKNWIVSKALPKRKYKMQQQEYREHIQHKYETKTTDKEALQDKDKETRTKEEIEQDTYIYAQCQALLFYPYSEDFERSINEIVC